MQSNLAHNRGKEMFAVMTTKPRFFVTICSPNHAAMKQLHGMGIDLFRTTANPIAEQTLAHLWPPSTGSAILDAKSAFSVEALATLKEAEQLVRKGYVVVLRQHEDDAPKAKASAISAETWMKQAKGGN